MHQRQEQIVGGAGHLLQLGLRRSPLRDGMLFAVLAMCVSVTALMLVWRSIEKRALDGIRSESASLARAAASLVDVEAHGLILGQGETFTPAYESAVAPLRQIRASVPGLRYVYTCVLVDGEVRFVLDAAVPGDHDGDGIDDHSPVGQVYTEASSVLRQAMTGAERGAVAEAALNSDRRGTFLSAYAPIFGRDGRPVAVLGIDMAPTEYVAGMYSMRATMALAMVPVTLGAIALGLLVAHHRRLVESRSLQWARTHFTVQYHPEPVFWANERGEIVYVNQAAENLGILASGNRATLASVLRGMSTDAVHAAQKKAVRDGNVRLQSWLASTDGERVPMELLMQTAMFGGERVFCVYARDIRSRLEAEAELERFATEMVQAKGELEARNRLLERAQREASSASDAKARFLATMSHEVRTPLNGIMGMLDLLLRSTLDQTQRRYASLAKVSSENLLTLVNDILDFSKIEAGALGLEAIDISPRATIAQSVEPLMATARARSLSLTSHVHPDVPATIIGDSTRLRQVLTNLLSNALKFTSAGGVDLRCVPENDDASMLRFSVTDTGIGIDSAGVSRLFKPFSQADSSTTRKFGGTGLGLAICKQLVEAMGGSMGVSSEPGRGSTFWFTLPTSPAHATASSPGSEGTGVLRAEPRRVLLVGTPTFDLKAMSEPLASVGWTLDSVGTVLDTVRAVTMAEAAGCPFQAVVLVGEDDDPVLLSTSERLRALSLSRPPVLAMVVTSGMEPDEGELEIAGVRAWTRQIREPADLAALIADAYSSLSMSPSESTSEGGGAGIAPAARAGRIRGVRVLVAEDNDINQEIIREVLAQAGAITRFAGNGRECFEAWRAEVPDVILMDCQMPEVDGFEATRMIRRAEAESASAGGSPVRLTPIVALTANAFATDIERCLESGMDAYVSKPVDPAALFDAIGRMLAGTATTEQQDPSGETTVSEVIHYPSLLERCLNKPEVAERLLGKFATSAQQRVEELRSAAEARDATRLGGVAHALKGAAGNMSAQRVQAAAAEVERLASENKIDEAIAALDPLYNHVRECIAFIPTLADSSRRAA
ncbi:MAG: ATP-binding protein [Planctomyces sp.]